MQEELYGEIFAAEEKHWWFVARHRIVLHLLNVYMPPIRGIRHNVADLGCGCGMMLHRLAEQYDAIGIDDSRHAIDFALQRGVTAKYGALPDNVPLARESYDAVLMLDVLEHLKHDGAAVEVAASLLKPGGIMICTVPAHMWLWTKFDEDHHHFRRYSKKQLRSLFDQPSFRLELLSHLNAILFAPAALWRILATKVFERDRARYMRLPPFNSALGSIFASERLLLGKLPMPLGLSFIAVARKISNTP